MNVLLTGAPINCFFFLWSLISMYLSCTGNGSAKDNDLEAMAGERNEWERLLWDKREHYHIQFFIRDSSGQSCLPKIPIMAESQFRQPLFPLTCIWKLYPGNLLIASMRLMSVCVQCIYQNCLPDQLQQKCTLLWVFPSVWCVPLLPVQFSSLLNTVFPWMGYSALK